jgi:hypothetical protein
VLQLKVVLSPEGWDEKKQEFVEPKTQILQLEHSLVSLSKWESKWCKPFLSNGSKTPEEILDYIKFMTITQNVKPEVYDYLSQANIEQINKYIEAPMTATTFSEDKNRKHSREVITAELIYYWMIALQIPFECQKWHLNKLLTLIRVCNIKNAPPKKMSKRDIATRNAQLNAARRKQLNSKG